MLDIVSDTITVVINVIKGTKSPMKLMIVDLTESEKSGTALMFEEKYE